MNFKFPFHAAFVMVPLISSLSISIAVGCKNEDSYDNFNYGEPTKPEPLSQVELEAAAKSFYLDNRYAFQKWNQAIQKGNSYDIDEANKDLQERLLNLVLSGRYTESDAQSVFRLAANHVNLDK